MSTFKTVMGVTLSLLVLSGLFSSAYGTHRCPEKGVGFTTAIVVLGLYDIATADFFLLADRATIESHTVAVYTTSQTMFILPSYRNKNGKCHAVAVYTTSQTMGIRRGHVVFHSGHVLRVFEQVDLVTHQYCQVFL